jgi:hypothetical protein
MLRSHRRGAKKRMVDMRRVGKGLCLFTPSMGGSQAIVSARAIRDRPSGMSADALGPGDRTGRTRANGGRIALGGATRYPAGA